MGWDDEIPVAYVVYFLALACFVAATAINSGPVGALVVLGAGLTVAALVLGFAKR